MARVIGSDQAQQNGIELIRIIHGARDIPKLFE
jgi:hypothetical protein